MRPIRILAPNIANTSIGGGWTFLRNFQKAVSLMDELEIVKEGEDYDILFAFAPNTISGEYIQKAHRDGKVFVLRMDGVPEDSRNSGRGVSRMISHAQQADFIIYQSEFIKDTVGAILRENRANAPSRVVFNGVDTNIFTPDGAKIHYPGKLKIFHIAYRKDPNKRYEEVVQMYRTLWTMRKDVCLILFGRYPTEWNKYNYGFFNGEHFKPIPPTDDTYFKATAMRSCDLMFYPSFADPAPNVVLEAMASGLPVIHSPYGGAREYIKDEELMIDGTPHDLIIRRVEKILKDFKAAARVRAENFDLPTMGANYLEAFMTAQHYGPGDREVETAKGGDER